MPFSRHPSPHRALNSLAGRTPLIAVPCVQSVTNPAFHRAPVLAARSPGTDALFLNRRLPSILHACIKNSPVPLCSWWSLRPPHLIARLGTLNLLRNPFLLFRS